MHCKQEAGWKSSENDAIAKIDLFRINPKKCVKKSEKFLAVAGNILGDTTLSRYFIMQSKKFCSQFCSLRILSLCVFFFYFENIKITQKF